MTSSLSLKDQLLAFLASKPSGASDTEIRQSFGNNHELLLPIINELLIQNRLQLLQLAGGETVLRIIDEDKAAKLSGLTHEQILVYQEIEKAKNTAIWSGDIRKKLNMQTQSIDKTLKLLLSRGLIKLTRDVNRKNRKIYILSELEPAK